MINLKMMSIFSCPRLWEPIYYVERSQNVSFDNKVTNLKKVAFEKKITEDDKENK